MRILACVQFIAVMVSTAMAQNFSGRIRYANDYTNGRDSLDNVFGKRIRYFINDSNFKAYNEKDSLLFMFNSEYNTYYSAAESLQRDNRLFMPVTEDAPLVTTKLLKTRTICGHTCRGVEMNFKEATVVWYYDPSLKASKQVFSNHRIALWNRCMKMLDGAVPLAFTYTDKKAGITWSAIATEIQDMNLTGKDFAELPGKNKDIRMPMPEGWTDFREDKWTGFFPGKPLKKNYGHYSAVGYLNVDAVEFTIADSSQTDSVKFTVLETIFPDTVVNSSNKPWVETYMRGIVAYSIDKVQGKIVAESHIQLYGHPGIEIKILYNNGQKALRERLYLVGQRLFTVEVDCPAGQADHWAVEQFLNSFVLLN